MSNKEEHGSLSSFTIQVQPTDEIFDQMEHDGSELIRKQSGPPCLVS